MPQSLTLLTDLYELTMAYGYWKEGMHDREAAFHLFFRRNPFGGGFAVACGLGDAIAYLDALRFAPEDLEYLATLNGNDSRPLFDDAFLRYLETFRFRCDVDAIPEGTVVFPREPLVRVRGPILEAQFVESALLNIINFQTLIATKAARVALAAQGEPVLEFGLRRAQGPDGAISAARAAWIGGIDATSNVLAGKLFDIPVAGTHAHSWVSSFPTEEAAFEAWAKHLPNNAVLLVDTYDTLEGVRKAANVGQRLRERGYAMIGVRLDSGDLAWLSRESRKILDAVGLQDAAIYASNDLDEEIITSLRIQDAAIDRWGVGTRLVTGHGDPALGGVYKLTAIRADDGTWSPRVKVSEQAIKTTTPGILQVRRFVRDGEYAGDMIFDEVLSPAPAMTIVDPADPTRRKHFPAGTTGDDLLLPVYRRGERVYDPPPLTASRERRAQDLARFHAGIKRLVNPHSYPVGLEEALHHRKTRMIAEARGEAAEQ
ncbi:MAG: nicotinate phosphoribosyltransferase [Thermoanaerobaculia bacterium]